MTHTHVTRALLAGLLADGLNSILAVLMTSPPNTTFSQCRGLSCFRAGEMRARLGRPNWKGESVKKESFDTDCQLFEGLHASTLRSVSLYITGSREKTYDRVPQFFLI